MISATALCSGQAGRRALFSHPHLKDGEIKGGEILWLARGSLGRLVASRDLPPVWQVISDGRPCGQPLAEAEGYPVGTSIESHLLGFLAMPGSVARSSANIHKHYLELL